MFDKELANKIDQFIKEKFPIIYEYKFSGIVFLRGGTIRSLIMGIPVNDLDFVILTQGECQIIDFIRKFKLKYHKNAGGTYKIICNSINIDIASYNDLLDTACYDIDYVFYDIEKRLFISCGAINAINNRMITEVNSKMNNLKKNILRLNKLIKFIKYVTKDDSKVRVKQNTCLLRFKLLKNTFMFNWKKLFNNNFKRCFIFLNGCKKQFNTVFIFSLLISIISIIVPILFVFVYSKITSEKYFDVFLIGLLIILVKIFVVLCSSKLKIIIGAFQKKMSYNISSEVSHCMLNCKLDRIDDDENCFVNKLKFDPDTIAAQFVNIEKNFIELFVNCIMFVVICYLNYIIGILFLIGILIIGYIKNITTKKMRRKNGFTKKHINDMFNCLSTFGDMFYLQNDNLIDESDEIICGDSRFVQIIYNVLFIIILLLELLMLFDGKLNTFLLIMYSIMLYGTLNKINKLSKAYFNLSRSCYRVFNLIDGPLYVREILGDRYSTKCSGKIEFSNVNFRYDFIHDYILNLCSFEVMPGEILGISGVSNSGKTTILRLIARLYNVDDGLVKIDDIDINEYDEKYIRENISIVSQHPFLFDRTIKDNFKFIKEDLLDEDIASVCELVYLDEFIQSLPNKYDTVLGSDGISLNGIQKQKLGIARALIKNIRIILLDDVIYSSKKDISDIKNILKNISRDHTIVLVTNNKELLKNCSKIMILNGEKVIIGNSYN